MCRGLESAAVMKSANIIRSITKCLLFCFTWELCCFCVPERGQDTFQSSLRRVKKKACMCVCKEAEGASLLQTFTGSIMPRLTSNIFLPTGCTIRSLLSGLESGGCVGSKKWALSHWIMPLFQLLWPGMPNFTARYSSLCVNQSFARGRGAHWVRPPAPCESDPTIDPPQTISYVLIPPRTHSTGEL